MIKDSTNSVFAKRAPLPSIVILAHFARPLVLVRHIDRSNLDVDIGEDSDAPEFTTEGEGDLSTSTSALTTTSKLIRETTVLPHPTTTAIILCFIAVPQKFL